MKQKKHIVIDARLYGPKHTGLGRYTKNLLIALKDLPEFNKFNFTLLVYPELLNEIKSDLGNSFNYRVCKYRHYSLKEQLFLPFFIRQLKPDLTHFTHLDKPILYFGKSAVTIHDLIRHFSKGGETTTKSPFLYWPKYFGYLLMTRIILWTSFVIVPSDFWRDFIIKKYSFNPHKIITTHEAVDPIFIKKNRPHIDNCKLKTENYLLYTGNLYPHKNITIVFKALKKLPKIKLKIICARSVFTQKIEAQIKREKLTSQVEFLGFVPDSDFSKLYSHALALVHPSLMEGFSLTGLEAMALNCPVIAAKASCLPEIYGPAALYFNPYSTQSLVKTISKLKNNLPLRNRLIKLGQNQYQKYDWSFTAQKTLDFYKQIIN